jgi:hypothetical protein
MASRAIALQQKTPWPVQIEIKQATHDAAGSRIQRAGLRTEDTLITQRIKVNFCKNSPHEK